MQEAQVMICKVYHSQKQLSCHDADDMMSANLREYALVAAVYVSEALRKLEDFSILEYVFRLTKNSGHPWWKNPEIFVFKESRSTTVGDIIIDGHHTAWLCAPQGWRPVPFTEDKEEII
jgi:hypothetical protein